jgi:hypothetical protein
MLIRAFPSAEGSAVDAHPDKRGGDTAMLHPVLYAGGCIKDAHPNRRGGL